MKKYKIIRASLFGTICKETLILHGVNVRVDNVETYRKNVSSMYGAKKVLLVYETHEKWNTPG